MNRRDFVTALAASLVVNCSPALAQSDSFETLLADLASGPDMVEASWAYREPTVSRGVGHGTPSNRKLSQSASDLIIACEVASPVVYDRRYRRPIWPKGQSGVTIGVGYDLRFANREYLDRDWAMLTKENRNLLAKVLTLAGEKARQSLSVVSAVEVPWDAARQQFFAFLPYPTKQTEDAFPNTTGLPDDSFGALVSLVYNRGPLIARNSQKRREMYEIQQLMTAKRFTEIPDRIRSMKRLWQTPDSRGLVIRREAEAVLFERGLKML
jgi:hypothetical protein